MNSGIVVKLGLNVNKTLNLNFNILVFSFYC